MTTIERVARIICEEGPDAVIYGATTVANIAGRIARIQYGEPAWRLYEKRARRIIEAIREPTDKMVNAGAAMVVNEGEEDGGHICIADPDTIFMAMIDAALEEQETE